MKQLNQTFVYGDVTNSNEFKVAPGSCSSHIGATGELTELRIHLFPKDAVNSEKVEATYIRMTPNEARTAVKLLTQILEFPADQHVAEYNRSWAAIDKLTADKDPA